MAVSSSVYERKRELKRVKKEATKSKKTKASESKGKSELGQTEPKLFVLIISLASRM